MSIAKSHELRDMTFMSDTEDTFGARLRALRGTRSRREVSIATGVTEKTIQRLENGETSPSTETQEALATYFGVTLDQLHGRRAPGEQGERVELEPEGRLPEDVVERVVEDLQLNDEQAEQLRRTQWLAGLPSELTLRSYATDIRGKSSGKLADRAPVVQTKLPEGTGALSPRKRR